MGRQAVSDETSARIKLEDKHNENMGRLNERIDASQRTNVEHLQDLTERIKNVSVNHSSEVQGCVRQVHQTQAAAEAVQTDMGSIRNQLEERIMKLDSQFQDLKLKKPLQSYERKCIEGIGSGLTSSTPQQIQQTSMPPTQTMPPMSSLQQGQSMPTQSTRMPQGVVQRLPKPVPAQQL